MHDGSVSGQVQIGGAGPVRYARLPINTIQVRPNAVCASLKGLPFDPMRTSYFVGRNSFTASSKPLLPRWQRKLFLTQSRFAASAGDFFGLPANRVVELGSRIEI